MASYLVEHHLIVLQPPSIIRYTWVLSYYDHAIGRIEIFLSDESRLRPSLFERMVDLLKWNYITALIDRQVLPMIL